MPSVDTLKRFLLLYGSQTGQAQAIAEEICNNAPSHGFSADLHCLSQTEKKFNIVEESVIVFVISTTGEGDPPDPAQKFCRRLRKKTLPDDYLKDLSFTLLGLGDSNYNSFCQCGKMLDQRLRHLGGQHFYPCGWGDDALGLEVVVEPWMEGLWIALQEKLGLGSEHIQNMNSSNSLLCNGMQAICEDGVQNGFDKYPPTYDVTQHLKCAENSAESSEQSTMLGDNFVALSDQSGKSPLHDINRLTNTSIKEPVANGSVFEAVSSEKSLNRSPAVCNAPELQSSLAITAPSLACQEPTLTLSIPPLSDCALSLPLMPPEFIEINYDPHQIINARSLPIQNDASMPSCASDITLASVNSSCVLTRHDAVKTALELTIDLKNPSFSYMPGDSFSVVCPNSGHDVEKILARLSLSDLSDCQCSLSILPSTEKRNATIPTYLPKIASLRHYFTNCLDLREPPKKALLRVLVEYTRKACEKRRLQELCSKQGMQAYASFIREHRLSLYDILYSFPSCQPPVNRIIELLPRLQPRPYSIASSPLENEQQLRFIFNIVHFSAENGRSYSRQGVCTGWLSSLTQQQKQYGEHTGDTNENCSQRTADLAEDKLATNIQQLDIDNIQIPIFLRTNQRFHPPSDMTVPLIMIGPGTGIAPFMGFLQHRKLLSQRNESSVAGTDGETWLFYGCRHEHKDYLYRFELEEMKASGILSKLYVCFSRDPSLSPDTPKYVQDLLRVCSCELVHLLTERSAMLYVCGDARGMAPRVQDTFVSMLSQEKGWSDKSSREYMANLRIQHRYLEDVWT